MSAKGLNPGYVHGRIGLPPEQWLSPVWFESFGAAMNQARSKVEIQLKSRLATY